MLELLAGVAILLGGREEVPVAHIRHEPRPYAVPIAVRFSAAEPLDDRSHLLEPTFGIAGFRIHEVAGRRAQVGTEVSDLLIDRGVGDDPDDTSRAVVDRAERLIDPIDSRMDLIRLPTKPVVEPCQLGDGVRVELVPELRLEPRQIVGPDSAVQLPERAEGTYFRIVLGTQLRPVAQHLVHLRLHARDVPVDLTLHGVAEPGDLVCQSLAQRLQALERTTRSFVGEQRIQRAVALPRRGELECCQRFECTLLTLSPLSESGRLAVEITDGASSCLEVFVEAHRLLIDARERLLDLLELVRSRDQPRPLVVQSGDLRLAGLGVQITPASDVGKRVEGAQSRLQLVLLALQRGQRGEHLAPLRLVLRRLVAQRGELALARTSEHPVAWIVDGEAVVLLVPIPVAYEPCARHRTVGTSQFGGRLHELVLAPALQFTRHECREGAFFDFEDVSQPKGLIGAGRHRAHLPIRHSQVSQLRTEVRVVHPAGDGVVVALGDEHHRGESAEHPLRSTAPALMDVCDIDQLARERHLLFVETETGTEPIPHCEQLAVEVAAPPLQDRELIVRAGQRGVEFEPPATERLLARAHAFARGIRFASGAFGVDATHGEPAGIRHRIEPGILQTGQISCTRL